MKLSRNLESFQLIWKVSRQSENFPNNVKGLDDLETFQTIWKVFRHSGTNTGNQKTLQKIWKVYW